MYYLISSGVEYNYSISTGGKLYGVEVKRLFGPIDYEKEDTTLRVIKICMR
jgi:hypothetical protein